jgi:hypothetical protein
MMRLRTLDERMMTLQRQKAHRHPGHVDARSHERGAAGCPFDCCSYR